MPGVSTQSFRFFNSLDWGSNIPGNVTGGRLRKPRAEVPLSDVERSLHAPETAYSMPHLILETDAVRITADM